MITGVLNNYYWVLILLQLAIKLTNTQKIMAL